MVEQDNRVRLWASNPVCVTATKVNGENIVVVVLEEWPYRVMDPAIATDKAPPPPEPNGSKGCMPSLFLFPSLVWWIPHTSQLSWTSKLQVLPDEEMARPWRPFLLTHLDPNLISFTFCTASYLLMSMVNPSENNFKIQDFILICLRP